MDLHDPRLNLRTLPAADREFADSARDSFALIPEADDVTVAAELERHLRARWPDVLVSPMDNLAALAPDIRTWYAYRDGLRRSRT